ncbi:hypothetical protein CL634_09430, partial [bacterium]|nr:hypothetical protein [bacterium]
ILAFLLGIISHFVLDAIPHTDPEIIDTKAVKAGLSKEILTRFRRIVAIDVLLVLTVVMIALNRVSTPMTNSIMLGAIGGILPDAILGLSMLYGAKKKVLSKYVDFHAFFHFPHDQMKLKKSVGIWTQVVTLGLAYVFLP